MTPDAMADYFRARLGAKVAGTEVAFGQLTVTLQPDVLPTAARLCKEDDKLDFAFFDFMTGVDLGEDGFAVVTHLYSVSHRHHVNLRAVAPGGREDPRLPSITGVYRGAIWHEREVYDMFGVTFDGHPGLLPRILTVENFEGFPLRKDFLLSTREAKAWPGLKEPKEVGGDDEDEASADAKAEEKKAAAQAKAERAKAKAAEMRAKKRAEREAAAGQEQAAAAERTGGGDTDAEAAAQTAAAAGEESVQTPEGAAEVAQSDIAKDAAAGSVQGDTLAGAPGDEPGEEQPVSDPAAEEHAGEGAPPVASGAPGTEAEGAHADTPVGPGGAEGAAGGGEDGGPAAEPGEQDRGVDAPEPTEPRTAEGTGADADPGMPHEASGSQGEGGVEPDTDEGGPGTDAGEPDTGHSDKDA